MNFATWTVQTPSGRRVEGFTPDAACRVALAGCLRVAGVWYVMPDGAEDYTNAAGYERSIDAPGAIGPDPAVEYRGSARQEELFFFA